MTIYEFYNHNQVRKYPFHERCSLTDKDNKVLFDGLLADLSLSISSEYGKLVYVSSVTKHDTLYSIVFSSALNKTPLAIISVNPNDFNLHLSANKSSQIPVKPLVPGVAGYVVIGESIKFAENDSWIFENPEDSLIQPRAIFSLDLPSSQDMGVLYSGRLFNGVVDISGEGDIDVIFEDRILQNRRRQAIVIRLNTSSPQVLADYSSSLPRPESRSCGSPEPVESINNVIADCCGRIFIEFRGCAEFVPFVDHCGVVVECPYTLEEICPADVNWADIEDPDQCLAETGDNPLNPLDNQPDFPTLPPDYNG